MSKALIGMGTQFLMAATPAAAALTKLAEVFSASPPNETVAEVEVTNYDSDGDREFIAGLRDAGSTTFELNWVPGSGTDQLLSTAKGDRLTRTMRLVTPPAEGAQQFTFSGFVTGYERGLPMDDRLTATVTVRITGAVVEAEAAADPKVI